MPSKTTLAQKQSKNAQKKQIRNLPKNETNQMSNFWGTISCKNMKSNKKLNFNFAFQKYVVRAN